jgi:hypothetical protein
MPRETEYRIHDGESPALALRVNASRRELHALCCTTAARCKRNLTLAKHGSLAPEQAGRLAKERLAEIPRDSDPWAERRRARRAADLASPEANRAVSQDESRQEYRRTR